MLWVLVILLTAVIWLPSAQVADGKAASAEDVTVLPLSAPSGVAAAEPDPNTAFREEDAGISAYTRANSRSGGGSDPRLDVEVIVDKLTSAQDSGSIKGEGKLVDLGLNFGIVELPMRAAEIGPAPVENVSVYFDDQGWIVAYLRHDRPAAAIWKHSDADGATINDPKTQQGLERNLLVIAIDEVLKAQDQATGGVNPSDVDYYDWTCGQCDSFVLFSGVSENGTQDEIKFVVPYTISLVHASAALVMTEQVDVGSSATSNLSVDGKNIVSATADKPLNSADIALSRDVERTSLHRVRIDGPSDNVAIGVVMLLYDRP